MKIKYDNHPKLWKKITSNSDESNFFNTWTDKSSLDYWRHNRIRESIGSLLKSSKDKKWITIGDGRFGTDANFLLSCGVTDVTATDISDELLKIGAERGIIKSYSAQNAEHLSFADESFDYSLCKESYHHFPRPIIALYEMLRISKLGVVLLEPNQQAHGALSAFKGIEKKHQFETVGNYVYTVSTSEIEKLMLGIGLRFYAFKGINDYYIEGIEQVPEKNGGFSDYLIRLKLKSIIWIKNVLVSLHVKSPNLLSIIIFKKEPQSQLKTNLIQNGFKFVVLPKNPYE
jgi:ubiquinone/menaquinone biosynthesis C-methylase UbiE